MKDTYDTAMTRGVFPHEGGYTDEAADPGGPTNWGITIADARMYWKPSASALDVRSMPKLVAEDIYRKHYAAPIRYDALPAGVDYSVLDYAINSGVGRAGKVLRRLVGLPDNTSVVTTDVLDAVRKRDPVALVNAVNDERLMFLQSLKIWPVYKNGWGRRVSECRALSLSFAKSKNIPALSNAAAQGKGAVPEPKAIKKAIVVGGGTSGAGLVAWAYRHPALASSVGIAVVIAIGGVIYVINQQHQKQQHAATPGIEPVKEAA